MLYQMRPSFIGGSINGILMTIVLIYAIVHWSILDSYQKIIVMSLLAIQIGLHALLHHMEEVVHDFNPLENKW